MSRIRVLGASLIALAAGIGSAAAADLPVYSPPPEVTYNAAPAYSWTGPYIGGIVGYGWGDANGPGFSWNADGFGGGVFAGYNFQPDPSFVVGIEGDIQASAMNGSSGLLGGPSIKNTWNGTLRARAGFAVDRFLVYGTGGVAFGGLTASNAISSDSATKVGWTLGGGVEAAITNNVTARLEYRYTDLGTHTYALAPATPIGFTSHQVLAGVGFKF
jgi:outer membrane immunogenic protein